MVSSLSSSSLNNTDIQTPFRRINLGYRILKSTGLTEYSILKSAGLTGYRILKSAGLTGYRILKSAG